MQFLLANLIQNTAHHLAIYLFSISKYIYNGSLAFIKSGWIYIRADSYGAYESCFELNRNIFLKCFRPSNFEIRYSTVSRGSTLSSIVSCLRHKLFLNFCRTQIPASITEEALTLYPICGVEKVMKV
jgi:hypothetical protein